MRALVVGAALLAVAGCGEHKDSAPDPSGSRSITVTSPAFGEGEPIPTEYTCHGDGTSPELGWSGVPSNASVTVVVDDPDAPGGDFIHWVVTVMPEVTGIDAGATTSDIQELPGASWKPPCPPSGTHHYRFTVYALPADETFSVEGGGVTAFVSLIAQKTIAWGRLTGTVTAE